ncbi:hypothetical protein VPH35_113793 [Triticum aestivum]
MDAQGALDSLLGRLTTILADEARLLGALHGDVQFIKDEMGSMNGLLLHLTEADHRDHHVRAWMKQVVGLTRDCEGNVELYIHNVTGAGHHGGGFLGYLRHIVRYVRTIPERHRIATRIQELKVRARDVGDRKLRYGVTVPPAADQYDAIFMDDAYKHQGQEEEENDAWRRFHLVYYPEDEEAYLQKIIDDNIKFVLPEEEPVEELTSGESKPRIFLMMFSQHDLADKSNFLHSSITEGLYEQKMGSFSCKALVNVYTNGDFKSLAVILGEILDQLEAEKSTETSPGDNEKDEAMQLTKKLEGYLKDYEAYCCFDVLFLSGFIQPVEISDMGKIKTFTLHPIVHESISRIGKDLNFVDTVLPSDLTRHLPIHSRTRVQASHVDHSVQAAAGSGIVPFLPYLAKSSQWQLMKMLDLEGCRGLKKQHLKSICKIILLKYLSLRNTDITELPKQIEKLQRLETLDIRQTAVQSFPTKSIMLLMLKHLLAGQGNNSDRFQESFTAMRLPSGVRGMKKLEILSRVVSDNADDSIDVGHLLQLRKLGVILSGKNGSFGHLLQQIEKLHGSLLSLSIQINQTPEVGDTLGAEEVVTLVSPPKLLQSLKISGITSGLLLWIAELDQLTKLTLSRTYLTEDYICILGKLAALRCLSLHRNSYTGSRLTFKEREFKSLKSLVVDGDIITNITFDTKAAPKLEMIVWSFAKMESISGLRDLWSLKKLELNGDCNPGPVRRALGKHPYDPEFKHNPRHGHQEDGAVVAASPP